MQECFHFLNMEMVKLDVWDIPRETTVLPTFWCFWISFAKTLPSGNIPLTCSIIHLLVYFFIHLFITSSTNPINKILYCAFFYELKRSLSPSQLAQLGGTYSHKPKQCGFDIQPQHIYTLWVWSPVGLPMRKQPISVSLSLDGSCLTFPLSLPLPHTNSPFYFSQNNEKIALGWG